MLIIRLQRVGRRNSPDFRLVLAEKHRSATKKVIEVFGEYNPRTKLFHLKNEEKLKTWIARKVELSPTAHNLLVTHNLVSGKKVKAWKPKAKPETAKTAEAPAATAPAAEAPAPAAEVEKPV